MSHPCTDLTDQIISKFEKSVRKLILTDKDYILKSSRGFVSFIRSFKEHKLSNVLKFKNLDVFNTARSFFLFKLPVIREFADAIIEKPLATEEELKKFETAQFVDKNQEQMIKTKIGEAIEKSNIGITIRTRDFGKESSSKSKVRKGARKEKDQIKS